MRVSVLGIVVLLLAVLVVGTIVVSVTSRLFRRRGDDSAIQAAPGVMLDCPHCGSETEAAKPQCQHCSKDL